MTTKSGIVKDVSIINKNSDSNHRLIRVKISVNSKEQQYKMIKYMKCNKMLIGTDTKESKL